MKVRLVQKAFQKIVQDCYKIVVFFGNSPANMIPILH